MKQLGLSATLAATVLLAGPALSGTQPYAGQEGRNIASLSQQDVDDLLAGRGWGLAKPAELNGYPGPSHVLELADDLNLTDEQRRKVQAIFDRMQNQAKRLGAEYVAAEAKLDAAFDSGKIDQIRLEALTLESGRLFEALRNTHLAAHLEVRPLLTQHQIAMYDQLRGYAGGAGHGSGGGHSGHGAASHD